MTSRVADFAREAISPPTSPTGPKIYAPEFPNVSKGMSTHRIDYTTLALWRCNVAFSDFGRTLRFVFDWVCHFATLKLE